MKLTRRILFLLMFVFVSACNSTSGKPSTPAVNMTDVHNDALTRVWVALTMTQAALPTATATGTSTPEATPTPEVKLSAADQAILNLPVVLKFEMSKFNDLPEITPAQAVSPAYDAYLNRLVADKVCGFKDARYVAGYEFGSTRWQVWPRPAKPGEQLAMEKEGYTATVVGVSDSDFSSGTFADPMRRPEFECSYARMTLGGAEYLVMPVSMLNADQTSVWGKLIVRKDKLALMWKYLDPLATKSVILPKYYPVKPDFKGYADSSDKNYFDAYWSPNAEAMKAVVAKIQSGGLQIPPDFGIYLWEAGALPTTAN